MEDNKDIKHTEEHLISIVMPVYNCERFLCETIQNIQNQTYGNWELIAVNDCSTDGSLSILNKFAEDDARIKVFSVDKNGGAAVARNYGIRNITGNFLAFIDSDDRWEAEKLQIELNFILKHDYAFVFSAYDLIDMDGKKLGKKVDVPARIDFKEENYNNIIWTSTVLLDMRKIGEFQMPNIRAGQDLATWLMLLKKVPYAYGINQYLASYRQVKGSISHNLKQRMTRTWRVYRTIENYTVIKSLYLYSRHIFCVLNKRKKIKNDIA